MKFHENNIEFLNEDEKASASFTSKRFINKMMRLREQNPDDVEIVALNSDGSATFRFPKKWVRISVPRKFTEEERENAAERLRNVLNSSATGRD